MWYGIELYYTVFLLKFYSANLLYIFIVTQFCCESVIYKAIELFDLQLRLLGSHQLQNAVTATCTALCLRAQGVEVELFYQSYLII